MLLISAILTSACGRPTEVMIETNDTADVEAVSNWSEHQEYQKHQARALEILNVFTSNFELREEPETGNVDYNYDADFGGVYLNADGDLVICVKNLTVESCEKYTAYCGTDEVIISNVTYSLEELREYAKMALELLGEGTYYGISEERNCVDLYAKIGTILPDSLTDAPIVLMEIP